jgi:hypothetical protein
VAELHGGAETGEEETTAPDVAKEGEEGGDPGARMPLAAAREEAGSSGKKRYWGEKKSTGRKSRR